MINVKQYNFKRYQKFNSSKQIVKTKNIHQVQLKHDFWKDQKSSKCCQLALIALKMW